MGQTSRDIAGALNFRSGLVPMAFDAEPAKEPERIRFASTEAKTPAQRRREAAEAEAAKKTAQDDDMSDMGMTGDPPTSEAQRKAMWAAKSGNSTLGIPQSVGAEFAKADPGGKLPSHAKDREIEFAPDKLYGVQTPDGGTGGPDNAVRVHDKQTDYEPRKGRWGGRAGHSMAKDGGPGSGPQEGERKSLAELHPGKFSQTRQSGIERQREIDQERGGYWKGNLKARDGRWGGRAHDAGLGLETEKAENNDAGTGAKLEESAGRRGGRASPHLKSGQALDGGPGSGPQPGGGSGYAKPEHGDLHKSFQISGRGTFKDYNEAAREGRKYARYLGKEVGLEKANEFGKTVYNVKPLPNKENRYGHEARMEVLSHHDPL